MFGSLRRNRIGQAPDDESAALRREQMVQKQIADRGISDPAVLEALRSVPRHLFVLDRCRQDAYTDQAMSISAGQTISQPYIVAMMTEALRLTPASRVLEVGTGSGYQSAVLAAITPYVFTIEVFPDLAERARAVWQTIGCSDHITSRIGDGSAGWPEHAPFDAIIVTCAPMNVPDALVDQLAIGGNLCIPTGRDPNSQRLHLLTKRERGSLSTTKMIPVRFVPMLKGDRAHRARDDQHNDR